MEEAGAYSLGSEEVTGLICDPCKHDGHHAEAMGFCINCHEFLCGTCCKYHTKPLPCRDHTILNKADMPKKRPLNHSLPVEADEGTKSTVEGIFDGCLKHEGEFLKYYCGDHFDFGCSVCMTIGHRACEHVQYIPEVAKTVNDSMEFKQFEHKLMQLTETAHKNVNKAKGNETELKRSYNETKEHIEEFRIKINKRLDQLHNEMKLQTDKLMQECTEKMNRIEKDVCEVAEKIVHLKADVDDLVQTRQNVKLFMKMKRSEDEANYLSAVVNQTMNKIKTIELKFKPDEKLQAIVNDLLSFGSCKQNKSHKGKTLTYIGDFSVRSSTDRNLSNIVDLVILSDNLFVLVDESNDKVKVLDMINGVLLERSFNCLRAITRIGASKVAVSYSGCVELLTISNSDITTERKLFMSNVRSLLYLNKTQHLMAMCIRNGSGEIVVYDLNGSFVRTLRPDTVRQQECCITSSVDDNTIYITEVAKNRVCSYTTDGTQKGVYTTKHCTDQGKWLCPKMVSFMCVDINRTLSMPYCQNTRQWNSFLTVQTAFNVQRAWLLMIWSNMSSLDPKTAT